MKSNSSRILPASLHNLHDQASRRWATLSAAGQRTITICAGLLAVGLCWALVYEPLQSGLGKNRQRIQELRVQAAQMREQAAIVQSIRNMAPVAASSAQAIADVAGLQGVFGPKAVVTIALTSQPNAAAGVATFKIAIDQIPYSVLVDRLEQATGRYRIRVVSMALTRTAGTSSATATAAPATPPPSTIVSGAILLADSK